MLRRLASGKWRLYARRKVGGRRRVLGTFSSRKAAEARERQVRYFSHRR